MSAPQASTERRRASAAALGGLLLLTAFLFRDAVFLGRTLFERDVHLMWYSQILAVVSCVRQGAWPLWNPLVGFGQPLLADANAQVAYPLTALALVLPPWSTYTLYVVVHFVLGGFGLYALARHLGVSPSGAFLAAAAWVASGPLLSLAPMWNQLAGAAWIPWIALAGRRALSSGRPSDVVLWSLPIGLPVLAGAPEGTVMGLVLTAALLPDPTRPGLRPRLRQVGVTLWSLTTALGLTAVQWLPSLDVARRSLRASLPYEARTYWSLHPLALLQSLLPVPLAELHVPLERRTGLFGAPDPFLASLYLGLPVLALALASLRRGRPAALAGVVALAALVSLGPHTPVYDVACAALPILRGFRYPTKALVLASVALALLAGLGSDAVVRRRRTVWPWVVVPAGAVFGAWAMGRGAGLRGAALTLRSAPALALTLAAALAALMLVRRLDRRTHAVLTAVVLIDLLVAHRASNPTAPIGLLTHRPEVLASVPGAAPLRVLAYDYLRPGTAQRHLGHAAPFVLRRAPAAWSDRAAYALALRLYLFPTSASAWGVAGSYDQDVPGLGPTFLGDLRELLYAAEGTPAFRRLLEVGAVDLVTALHDDGFGDLEAVGSSEGLFEEAIRAFRVPGTRPRVYAVSGSRVAADREALAALISADFDPTREVLLPSGLARPATPGFAGSARIVSSGAVETVVETDCDSPCYAVAVEAFDPGWRAEVDGRPSQVLRANVAFRAVDVPAGRHRVTFRYRPPAALLGGLISLVTLAASGIVYLTRPRFSGPLPEEEGPGGGEHSPTT